MTTRSALRASVLASVAAFLLAGCSGDDVREQAEGLASEAAESASAAAGSVVQDQICRVVEDSDVNAGDVELLKGLVEGAEAAGVDDAIIQPARRIAESGDQVPAEAVSELEEACAG